MRSVPLDRGQFLPAGPGKYDAELVLEECEQYRTAFDEVTAHTKARTLEDPRIGDTTMKYLFAWGLGVPGVLIVVWFLMSNH
jgi:hypothetical protein